MVFVWKSIHDPFTNIKISLKNNFFSVCKFVAIHYSLPVISEIMTLCIPVSQHFFLRTLSSELKIIESGGN